MTEPSARPSLSLPRPGTFLVLAIALFAPAPSAHAGCGDYLHHDQPPAARQSTPGRDLASKPHHLPCRGPACGRRQSTPLTPPATVVVHAERHALLMAVALAADPDNPHRTPSRDRVRAIHRCFPPERPPRA